ncbi:MAG TPA: type II toxin-antitoxin system Phd/YefM family antitoxin [Candidatus Limnocylindria bacterium]|nr:type II toxin-antitoxin system Phd/YefM family antitoxin [Candidatus Limnocylindria bacterium]
MAIAMVSVADLRARLAELIEQLRTDRSPLYVTQRGQARAVLLAVEDYDGLLDQLEYLDDSLEALRAKERRESGRERSEPLDAVMRQLRKRGRVPR